MKHGISALLTLSVCFILAACGYVGGNHDSPITPAPPPGPTPGGPDNNTKTMPEGSEPDHLLFAMNELMRVFQSSMVLLTTQEQEDFDLGCVHYQRVRGSDEVFRSAIYKGCGWPQSFAGQAFYWKLGADKKNTESFYAFGKNLFSSTQLEVTASAVSLTEGITEEAPLSAGNEKLGLGTVYTRTVNISVASNEQPNVHQFSSAANLGNGGNRSGDYWRTSIRGLWQLDAGRLKGQDLYIEFNYRSGKKATGTTPRMNVMEFLSLTDVTADDGKCPRPLGTFIWRKVEGPKVVDSGRFEAKKDGLHLPKSDKPIPWPKSCLEFTQAALN